VEGPRTSDRDQLAQLLAKVRELGATEEEIQAATASGLFGPLALDLALRGPGETLALDDFAAQEGLDPAFAHRIWIALGLPLAGPVLVRVVPRMAAALRIFVAIRELLGDDAVLALARVVGSSTARMAEALSDSFRVGFETPQLASGMPYADVVEDYTSFTRDALPLFLEAVGGVFQRHLVLVSHQSWSADEGAVAVTRQRTVGFADLVGSTEVLLAGSVAELAQLVSSFESLASDIVTQAGGRVVKLIGDEAMFVFEDAASACGAALDLADASPHPVRVGLAHGAVVGLHGDYYGGTVNLAARLVRAAAPDSVVVSEKVRQTASGFAFEPVDIGPLKGFPESTAAYALRRR
jgi:class 3 adenylate cyclase